VSVPAYPAYKDSGVEWLGEVPIGWLVARVRELVRLVNGFPFDAGQFTAAEGLPLVRIRDLNASEAAVRFGGEAVESALVTRADLLIGMDGDFNVGRWRGDGPALLNQRVCCLRGDPCILRLLEHALPTPLQRINDLTYSTTVKHLSSGQVLDIRMALPPDQAELEALVRFLDRETGKIDALVEEQRRLIALLKEKRQAVISHAVTKGLNPHAPLKPSGIEWLGDIPAHWETSALKRLVRLQSGEGITSEGIEHEGTYPVFGGNGQRGFTEDFTHEGEFVLIGRQGALCGNINYASGRFWASEHALVAHPVGRFEVQWLGEVLRAMNLGQYSVAAAQPGLSADLLGNLKVPVPPPAEQAAIAALLNRQTGKIDALAGVAERTVSLLQERRAALISAAVTGKIDVRGLVTEAESMEVA
jgi:type I restriction enzyme S subunit